MFPVEVNTADFVTKATYDVRSGLPVTQTDVMGITSKNVYDELYRLTDVYIATEPEGEPNLWLTHIEYIMDGINNDLSENYVYQMHKDFESYTYNDGLGRVIQTRVRAESSAEGEYRVAYVLYDARGNVYFESLPYFSDGPEHTDFDTGVKGVLTEFDPIGRAFKVTPPEGDVNSPTGPSYTDFRDGSELWVTVSTDPNGNKTKQYFDAQGRVTKLVEVITDDNDIETLYEYDTLGRLIKTYDNANNVIEASYDSLGRKIDTNDPDMGVWTYEYDYLGRLKEQTDARGNVVKIYYDPDIDRIDYKEIYNSSQTRVETISYYYDTSDDEDYTVHKGLLYKVEDYDEVADANISVQKFSYDSRGRPIKSTQYIGEIDTEYTTETSYDDVGRVTEVVYPNDWATMEYSYDNAGHLVKVEGTDGVPDGNVVFYEPNSFNEHGRLTGINFGNGLRTRYTFYPNSQRLKRIHTASDLQNPNTRVQYLTYSFDKVSNITDINDGVYSGSANGTLSNIRYDDLYRLTSLHSGGLNNNLTYSYNSLGNIKTNDDYGSGEYTYEGSGHSHSQPHAVTHIGGGDQKFEYDECGNMTNRDGDTLTYDARNRLIRVVRDSNTIEFGYGPDGARLYKKVNGEVTQVWIGDIYEEKDDNILCHVYVGDKLICTFEPAGSWTAFLDRHPYFKKTHDIAGVAFAGLFGGGRTPLTVFGFGILAGVYLGIRLRRDEHGGYSIFYKSPYRQLLSLTIIASVFVASAPEMAYAGTPVYDDPVFYYYHSDHLGSSNIMTDADGDLVQHYGYMPFGDERYQDNTDAFSVTNRYTGQQLDEETGLYFYGSRYYDPQLSRFIQPDSIAPDASSQSLNRYTYCFNNPLRFNDPSGHEPVTLTTILIGAAIGAGIGGGIAAAQGGDFWKGALSGAISGAFGAYGWGTYGVENLVGVAACTAAGGALGALVTGGDPAMAAATAAITSVVTGSIFGEGWVTKTASMSAEDKFFNELVISTGIGAVAGGVAAEISGGSFGQGAMWGAVGASAGYVVTSEIKSYLSERATDLFKKHLMEFVKSFTSDLEQQVELYRQRVLAIPAIEASYDAGFMLNMQGAKTAMQILAGIPKAYFGGAIKGFLGELNAATGGLLGKQHGLIWKSRHHINKVLNFIGVPSITSTDPAFNYGMNAFRVAEVPLLGAGLCMLTGFNPWLGKIGPHAPHHGVGSTHLEIIIRLGGGKNLKILIPGAKKLIYIGIK